MEEIIATCKENCRVLVANARFDDRLIDAEADPDGERRSKAVVDGQPQSVDEQFFADQQHGQLAASKSAVEHEGVQETQHRHVRHHRRRADDVVDHVVHGGVPDTPE